MKHIRAYNEALITGDLNDILNIARDEGLVVKIERNGMNTRTTIIISRSEDYTFNAETLMEAEPFFEIIQDIDRRIKSLYDDIRYLSYVKDFSYRQIRPSLRCSNLARFPWIFSSSPTLRVENGHKDLIGREILAYAFNIKKD
jgi:hypothetical protein